MMGILDLQGEFVFRAMNMLNLKTKKQTQTKNNTKIIFFFIADWKHIEVMVILKTFNFNC